MRGMNNAPSLLELAGEIIAAFGEADSSRLRAGRLLLQARELFEATKAKGESWRGWCTLNITTKKYRDIKRVMALARDPDPAAAIERERAGPRTRMAASRARGANVRPPETGYWLSPPQLVELIRRIVLVLTDGRSAEYHDPETAGF